VQWLDTLPEKLKPLVADAQTSPRDGAEQVIRSSRSRVFTQENGINPVPRNTVERPAGTITMDNTLYTRYAGELQVTRIDLPADERVNVLGRVIPEDRELLRFICPGIGFRFISC
jgi:hypothetical protein